MTEHKQQRVFGYGPIGGREYHDYTIMGREFKLTIKNWNEEKQEYDEEDFLTGKLLPGFESFTTKRRGRRLFASPRQRKATGRRTRRQKRAKTGKPRLVYKLVLRDRNKYLPNGRLKETV